ncbi:MAG TPA: hypothetical protein VGO49_06260 [Bradyrhizobium sp.]|nr:hypothetical protein [Bradyrhizobium sp.]
MIKPSIFNGDNGLRQMGRKVRGRQLGAFEHAACSEHLALSALERQSALGCFDLKAAGDGQRRNAVQDKSGNKEQS